MQNRQTFKFSIMKSSIKQRKNHALSLLEAQLASGTRPVKRRDYEITWTPETGIAHIGKPAKEGKDGNFSFIEQKDGSKKPELLNNIPLSEAEIAKKQKEIANLKRKLGITK